MNNLTTGGRSTKKTVASANRRLTKSTKRIIRKIRLSTPRWHPVALQMSAICSEN